MAWVSIDSFQQVSIMIGFIILLLVDLKIVRSFVVPTGSMAPTIVGYHKEVTCPKCGARFLINASAEGEGFLRERVMGCTCFNCRTAVDFNKDGKIPALRGGDRITVGPVLGKPARHSVTVHKYPSAWYQEKPQTVYYVSRIVGLPGETVALSYGRAYACRNLAYPDDNKVEAKLRWQNEFMHRDDPKALKLFAEGKFRIVRKSPDSMLYLRLPVHDNDFLDKKGPRYWTAAPDSAWKKAPKGFRREGEQKDMSWIRFRNLVPGKDGKPTAQLITDFAGFNSFVPAGFEADRPANWVSDLMLECEITLTNTQGEFWLELVKGSDRFQARWDLASGRCTLVRLGAKGKMQELANQPTDLKRSGTFQVRFANFDDRLTVWVDKTLPFGAGIEYPASLKKGPTAADLAPAGIAGKGGPIQIQRLKLWRAPYYGHSPIEGDYEGKQPDWSDTADWEELRKLPTRTFFVQPGHFFMVSDNCPASSDSRTWGVVPERFIHYQVLFRYFPFQRLGLVR